MKMTGYFKAIVAGLSASLFMVFLFYKFLGSYSIIILLLFSVDISYFVRTAWLVAKVLFLRLKVDPLEGSETTFWVLTTDLDFQGHMNNSRYLRECDFGRIYHLLASGLHHSCRKHGLGLVLGALTIRYRRSIELFQTVHLRTKILYWDEKAFYLEQQFISDDGFVCAVAIAKQSIVQCDKKKELVTTEQLICDAMGKQLPRPTPSKELELWIKYNSASSVSLRQSSQVS